ncbi:MAG: enoyl-ACP reductase [Bdellovibrionia bacterium]
MSALTGKKALIMGVANEYSLAWFIAKRLREEGVQIGLTYGFPSLEKRVRPLSESLRADFCVECDVTVDSSLKAAFGEAEIKWGGIDILVHSIAYARPEDLDGRMVKTTRAGFQQAMDVSVYSLIAACDLAEPLMKNGGAVLTLTNSGSDRVIPNYNVMGVAKSALESCVRYLAHDLGNSKIRINAISAGPVKTLSAGGIKNFNGFLNLVAEKSPLHENIDGLDVAELALFLSGPSAKRITGGTFFVDSGTNIMGA